MPPHRQDRSPSNAPTVPPPRRWWRFTVRRAMVLVLAVGGPIGWEANRASRMRRAVAVLERPVAGERPGPDDPFGSLPDASLDLQPHCRVEVSYDETDHEGDFLVESRFAWVPEWVRTSLGVDHFRTVTKLEFGRRPTPEDWAAIAGLGTVTDLDWRYGGRPTDADLRGLALCPGLRSVDLLLTPITDATLVTIGRLPTLRTLVLAGTPTTAEGMAALAGLTELEELTLSDEGASDAGLAHLSGLTHLRTLVMMNDARGVTDAGLAHLRPLVGLEELTVVTLGVTSTGVAHLAALPRLRSLRLSDYHRYDLGDPAEAPGRIAQPFWLTPTGAEALGRLSHLETLMVSDLPVNDACLRAIGRLGQLRELAVGGDAITDEGVAALAGLGQLQSLNLVAPNLTDAGLSALSRMPRLRDLVVNGSSRLTDASLTNFRFPPNLARLVLMGHFSAEAQRQFLARRPQGVQVQTHVITPVPTTLPLPNPASSPFSSREEMTAP